MKPKEFTEVLKKTCGENLVSVTLYGSAAAGDFTGKKSDYNMLVILKNLALNDLKGLAKETTAWSRKGNPPPLLFTVERLKQSTDVFPIELMDMKQSNQVLFGMDVLADIDVSDANLRLQIEHELRSKLITLHEQYLLTEGRARRVKELMVHSLSSFLVLFRAALRLFGDEQVPAQKMDALKQLSQHLEFDTHPFEQVDRLKQKGTMDGDVDVLFEKYLNAITKVIDAVDAKVLHG